MSLLEVAIGGNYKIDLKSDSYEGYEGIEVANNFFL